MSDSGGGFAASETASARLTGTYSPGFLPALWAVANLTLPEALLTGLVVAVSQTFINTRQPPTLQQAMFNAANLAFTMFVVRMSVSLFASERLPPTHPVLLAFAAAVYFALNTGVVSGLLTMLYGKPLREVAGAWYTWSLPYHLAGATALTFIPGPGHHASWEGVSGLLALLALLQFYCAIEKVKGPTNPVADTGSTVPVAARAYVSAIIIAAVIVVVIAFVQGSPVAPRLGVWLLLTAFASTRKVSLPGIEGTVSLNFVVLLAGLCELPLAELVVLAAAAGTVQCLWRPVRRVRAEQVAFSMAALTVSTALARWLCEAALAPGESVGILLAVSTAVLYVANTLLVSAVICLVSGNLISVWQRCHFWVFAYYLVGASLAALIVMTGRTVGWAAALLAAPSMYLAYVSYRLQVNKSTEPTVGAAA